MRLLCASDLHLGRQPTGLPDHLGLDPARIATSTVWDRIVELAPDEHVDAILLAGNVIDRENRFFEPLGPFERGLTILGQHGIPVYAIAGDHDFDVLRRIADTDAFHVIGRDGRWEQVTIWARDGSAVTVVGWSAPGPMHPGTPFAGFTPPRHADGPVIGLLHASIAEADPQPGDYAPVTRHDLGGWPVDLWIAGHGHTPHYDTDDVVPLLKPGSGSPLDPRERGPRGAWIVEIAATESARTVNARLVPLSPVRFAGVDLDLTGVTEPGDVDARLIGAVRDTLTHAIEEDPGGNLICVGCHVTVHGRTSLHSRLPELAHDLARTIDIQEGMAVAAIGSVTIDTRPPIDLEPLVGRPDPVGEIARLLTALDGDRNPDQDPDRDPDQLSPAHLALLQRTTTRLQAAHRSRVFSSIAADPEPNVAAARIHLRREGWSLLDALIQQRGME